MKGFTENKLKEYLKDEKWIMEVFNKFNEQKKEFEKQELVNLTHYHQTQNSRRVVCV